MIECDRQTDHVLTHTTSTVTRDAVYGSDRSEAARFAARRRIVGDEIAATRNSAAAAAAGAARFTIVVVELSNLTLTCRYIYTDPGARSQ